MSYETAGDIPWWRQQQLLSREKKAQAAIRLACARPGDATLIVTEGTVTEQVYFKLLRNDLKLSTVHVAIHPGDASDPRHVIATAERMVRNQARRAKKGLLGMNEPSKFDHVWAVVDTDVALRNGIWAEVKQLAESRRIQLAHSTPCFEYWLLLHLAGPTTRGDLTNGTAAKRVVEEKLGAPYSTSESVATTAMPTFIKTWPEAVKNAMLVRKYHIDANSPPPANPSTEVDRLVCVMNDSAQENYRRIPCR